MHFAPDGAFESWFFKNILQYFFSIFANLQTGWTQAFFTEPFSARRTFPEITIDCFVHLPLSMFHLNCCEHSLMDLHVWSSLMFVIAFILCCWHLSRQMRDRMMHVLNGNDMPKGNPKGKGKGKMTCMVLPALILMNICTLFVRRCLKQRDYDLKPLSALRVVSGCLLSSTTHLAWGRGWGSG